MIEPRDDRCRSHAPGRDQGPDESFRVRGLAVTGHHNECGIHPVGFS